jgi:uncharacterized protein (TIGR03067 family)
MSSRLVTIAVSVLVFASVAWCGSDKEEAKMLEGTWALVTADVGGTPFPEEIRKTTKLVLKGDKYVVTVGKMADEGTIKLDPNKKPKTMDITGTEGPNKGKTFLCIYELKDDMLTICYDLSGKDRPTEFKTKKDPKLSLATYKREKR